jgi:hypothetical protein
MKKIGIVILIISSICSPSLSGQAGTKQIGLRTGHRGGIFYQITHEAGNAEVGYNAMLGFNNNGIQLTGLKIIYETSLKDISPDLYFAWGYGGHAGFIYTDRIAFMGENYNFSGERFCPLAGIDGWFSAEYRFRDIPVNLSLNIKPYVELTIPSFVKIMPGDLGISISYIF